MELMIVFNPDDRPYPYTLQQMKQMIIDKFDPGFSTAYSFTLSKEYATHEHYHIFFMFKHMEYDDKTRVFIRRMLRDIFYGELRITKEKVRDKIRAIAYTIKDGDYVTHNMPWWDFSQAKQIAQPKEEQRYKVLIKTYYEQAEGKSEQRLTEELLDIYVKCYIPIDTERMSKIVKLATVKQSNNKEYRKRIVDQILDKL